MKQIIIALALLFCAYPAAAQTPQEKEAARTATREKLRQLLTASGPKKGINISFKQSEKQPFNFVGAKRDGLTNCDFLEVVISVTADDTVGFRVYPHYKGEYINLDKAKGANGLMRLLLNLSDKNFLYWGLTQPATSLPVTPLLSNQASRIKPSKSFCTALPRSMGL